jgi:hypothetical protein
MKIKRNPKFGDIIEIRTPKGLVYAQYTHKHDKPPRYGALIRILPGFFDERQKYFEELVNKQELFSSFVPLGVLVKRGIFEIVANEDIPERCKPFPLFKAGNRSTKTGKITDWWLWDGEKEWRVGALTPDQYDLPMQSVLNDTMLIHRIVSGWRPRDEV